MDLKRHISAAYRKGAGGSSSEPAKIDSARPPVPARESAAKTNGKPSAPKPAGTPDSAVRGGGAKSGVVKTVQPGPYLGGQAGRPGKTDIAKYLLAIGPDEASRILAHLDESEVEAIAREIAAIEYLEAPEAREVLERFNGLVKEGEPARGGVDKAREMLSRAFGDSLAARILSQALPVAEYRPFAFLAEVEGPRIVRLLAGEAPGVMAIVTAHLPPARAADVISALDAGVRKDIVIRLSRMTKVDTEVIERISRGLEEKLLKAGESPDEKVDGTASLASIMRHLDPGLEQQLLDSLEDEEPQVADRIRERLFTVDTLLLIDDRDLQKVLSGLQNSELAFFLKGKTEAVRRKILDNVSQNRAQLILEEYGALGPQRRLEVDQATRDFILRLRRLEQDGVIRVRRKDDEFVE